MQVAERLLCARSRRTAWDRVSDPEHERQFAAMGQLIHQSGAASPAPSGRWRRRAWWRAWTKRLENPYDQIAIDGAIQIRDQP
ncbi:MAG: hypothetical protein V3T43_02725 [Nitrosomonadaceae bacterium]